MNSVRSGLRVVTASTTGSTRVIHGVEHGREKALHVHPEMHRFERHRKGQQMVDIAPSGLVASQGGGDVL